MANLVWTAILYFSTGSIVYITYRLFVQDRQAERERATQKLMERAFKTGPRGGVPGNAPTAAPVTRRPIGR
jgi:hypothetical protein